MIAQIDIESGILLYQHRFARAETAIDGDGCKKNDNPGTEERGLQEHFAPFFPLEQIEYNDPRGEEYRDLDWSKEYDLARNGDPNDTQTAL